MNNRIDFIGKLPHKTYLALSGGADSMAILDFLMNGRKGVCALYFNHGTEHGDEAEIFVRKYCKENNVRLKVGHITREKLSGESPEEYWRNERYKFFSEFTDRPIIMVHHLSDQVETWLFSSIRNGRSTLIPYSRGNIIRPFLITKKEVFELWCERKGVPYVVDPGNSNHKHTRSFIRAEMVPRALRINPGIHTMIKKKVLREFETR